MTASTGKQRERQAAYDRRHNLAGPALSQDELDHLRTSDPDGYAAVLGYPTTADEFRRSNMRTLSALKRDMPDAYERLSRLANGEAISAPTTAQEWLDADAKTLGKLRQDDPEAYERLRDEALRLAATRPGGRRLRSQA